MSKIGSLSCAAIAVAMAALIDAAGFGFAALAQQAQTTGIVTFELFTGPDSVDLKPGAAQQLADAARRAQAAPGSCPLGRFTVFVAEGDPLLQAAAGGARRDVVLAALDRQGIDASRFFVDFRMFGGSGPGNDAQLDYDAGRDQTAPKLDVTWTPPKGTKVKAGQKIMAKAVASDDANRWQTGINTIDLDVQGGGSFGFQDYPRPQPPCERPPPPRTLEGVYTVPANPPPIVRLRAVTKDFAGHEARDIAEFPIADWYGTIKKTAKGGGHNHRIDIDYSFEVERSGTLKGRASARISTEVGEVPACTMRWTYSPSEFDIPLSGRRDIEDFEITLKPGTLTATITNTGPCAGDQPSNTFPSHLNPAVHAQTKYRIPARDGATDAIDLQAGALPWGVVMRDTITIHQARQ
jgi:hypothetical protein